MFEANNIVFGVCIFLVSIGAFFNKRQQAEALNHPPLFTPKNFKSALIDLNLPANGKEGLQNLVNDEILAKSVTDSYGKYFVCIHSEGRKASKRALFDYISSVYSKLWNEAVLKNCLGMECIVVSDELSAGLITRDEILCRPDLCTVFTGSNCDIVSLNSKRSSIGAGEIEVVDTGNFTKVLDSNLKLKTKVSFFDALAVNEVDAVTNEPKVFDRLALGGTFDQMHHGHRKLLTLAAASCNKMLTIGITGDSMLSKKSQASRISSFSQRSKNVNDFLQLIKPNLPLNIVELSDPYGPTITDPSIEGIIVSSETINGAYKINSLRKDLKMKELDILVTYRTDSAILSSSFIRDKYTSNSGI